MGTCITVHLLDGAFLSLLWEEKVTEFSPTRYRLAHVIVGDINGSSALTVVFKNTRSGGAGKPQRVFRDRLDFQTQGGSRFRIQIFKKTVRLGSSVIMSM